MTGYLAGRPGRLSVADASGGDVERKRGSIGYAALGCALLAAIWTAAFLQWFLYDQVVPWDSKNQFYAFYRFMAGAIESGASPFWNPYHYAGHPSVADPQSLIFALPFLAWAYVQPAPSLLAFDAFVFAHLLAGSFAIIAFGWREKWPLTASVLAGAVFMLGGVVSGRMNHVGILCAYGMFPIALVLMQAALDRRCLWAAAGFALVSSQIALGRSQVPLLLCFALLVLLIAHISVQPALKSYCKSRAPVILLMGIGALALLALPLLLSLQFIALSNRPAIPVDLAVRSSLNPLNLATLFAPNVFGSLEPAFPGWGPSGATLPGIDDTDRAFNYMFCGSLAALLLVWHGLAGGRLFARGRRAMALMLMLGLFYALGRFTPVYEALFEYAPGVSLFRRPNDGAFLFVIGLAFMCGHLAADYVRIGKPTASVWATGLIACCACGLLLAAIFFAAMSQKAEFAAFESAKAIVLLGALAWLLQRASGPHGRMQAMLLLTLWTSVELVWRNAGTPLNAAPAARYALLEKPRGEDARIVSVIKADMAQSLAAGHRPRMEVLGLDGPWQNAAMILGLEAINGYNPLRIGDYDRLIAPGESPHDVSRRTFTGTFPNYNCALSRRLGLRYLVLDQPLSHLPRKHDSSKFTPLIEGPRAWVYRNDAAMPSAWISTHVQTAAIDYLDASPGLSDAGQVIVDDDAQLSQIYTPKLRGSAAMATISSWKVDRIEIDLHTSEAAILTLNAPYYPGWRVEIDGVRKSIIKTDLLFRGVEVPAGARKAVFEFRPFALQNLAAALRDVLH
jgi:hypothetical protein